jgi:chaperonin GroES
MKIRPYGEYIVVKRAQGEEKTAGGIIIPDAARERPFEGQVLAVGTGKELKKTGKLRPLIVKPGDRILFSQYGGTEVTVGGEEHFIIEEDDVIAIYE